MPPGWPAVLSGLIRRFAETGHTLNSNRKMRGADPPLKTESVGPPLCVVPRTVVAILEIWSETLILPKQSFS